MFFQARLIVRLATLSYGVGVRCMGACGAAMSPTRTQGAISVLGRLPITVRIGLRAHAGTVE